MRRLEDVAAEMGLKTRSGAERRFTRFVDTDALCFVLPVWPAAQATVRFVPVAILRPDNLHLARPMADAGVLVVNG